MGQTSLSVLLVDIVLETMTFEMPFSHDWAIWMRKITWQPAEVPVVCACAWVGAYLAFRLFPKNLKLKPRQILWMACAFVLITYFGLSDRGPVFGGARSTLMIWMNCLRFSSAHSRVARPHR